MTTEVSNLSFCKGFKTNPAVWWDGFCFLLLPLHPSLSMFSGCQTLLRGLEGSVPPLQSHPLWQYLATPFIYIHTFKNTCTHRLTHLRIGERARIRPQRVCCGCGKRGNGWMDGWRYEVEWSEWMMRLAGEEKTGHKADRARVGTKHTSAYSSNKYPLCSPYALSFFY